MAAPASPTLLLSADEARDTLLARAIEDAVARGDRSCRDLTPADLSRAGARAAHAAGESADHAQLLVTRARLVLETARSAGLALDLPDHRLLGRLLSLALLLLSALSGAAFERVGLNDSLINLLSPPYWGVIAWNLAVYLFLLCALFRRPPADGSVLSPRSLLSWLIGAGQSWTLSGGWKRRFLSDWLRWRTPLIRLRAARWLHLAAACFALGLLASLLARGFGTALTAGWESTWLADRPEAVKFFLDHTYGLIPDWSGLPPLPDLETVATLRADRLGWLAEPVSAAPWLARLALLMLALVVAPRLALAGLLSWRLSRAAARGRLTLDDPYYARALAQCRQGASLGRLVTLTLNADEVEPSAARSRFLRHWPEPDDVLALVVSADADPPVLPEEAFASVDGRPPLIALWLSANLTPEEETHGRLLRALSEDPRRASDGPAPILVVDASDFAARFGGYPERLAERRRAWRDCGAQAGVETYFVGPDESPEALLDQLRDAAAGLPPNN